MFKMTGFTDIGPYLINSLKKYIEWLEKQLMDTVKYPNHRFLDHYLSMVFHRTWFIGTGVSDHIKVCYQFCTMFI